MKNLHVKSYNIDKTDKFLERCKLLKLTGEEIGNLNNFVSILYLFLNSIFGSYFLKKERKLQAFFYKF
jgi:hypothetical protein